MGLPPRDKFKRRIVFAAIFANIVHVSSSSREINDDVIPLADGDDELLLLVSIVVVSSIEEQSGLAASGPLLLLIRIWWVIYNQSGCV